MSLDTVSTSARSELAALSEEIAAAQQDRARAQEAVDRLERPTAEVVCARVEHATVKAEHDRRASSRRAGVNSGELSTTFTIDAGIYNAHQ